MLAILVLCAGCVTVPKAGQRARLRGVFWWITSADLERPIEQWQPELDQIEALGMDMIVLMGSARAGEEPDPLTPLFQEADRRGLSLFLDTPASPQWWTLEDVTGELNRAQERVQALERCYRGFSSFKGYYIPYETYVCWGDAAQRTKTLYREVAAACKAAAPGKVVMISPFFILDQHGRLGDFRYATPEEYEAFWTDVLGQSSIDIVALQDSGEHLSCYSMEDRRPFFEAMNRACLATATKLRANVETGELHVASVEDYVARFGAKTHVNDPRTRPFWRGVPAEKLAQKLVFVRRYTPTAITWGYREFIHPDLGPDAARLYDSYLELLGPKKASRVSSRARVSLCCPGVP